MCFLPVSVFVCIFGRFDVLRTFFKISFLLFISKRDRVICSVLALLRLYLTPYQVVSTDIQDGTPLAFNPGRI